MGYCPCGHKESDMSILAINSPVSQCAKLSLYADHLLVLVYGDINFHSGSEVMSFQKENYYE